MEEWIQMGNDGVGKSMYDTHPLTDQKRAMKRQAIETACQLENVELLQMLASSREGLINAELRAKSWPLLVGVQSDSVLEWEHLEEHKDEKQVDLDVDRTFVYSETKDQDIDAIRRELKLLISIVLRRNPTLSYYQGYHDIAQVILLVFKTAVNAAPFLEHITINLLRDFMVPSLHSSLDQLELIPPLLSIVDPYLGDLVRGSQPFWALSSIITMFAHHLRDFSDICTLFDFIFASDMHMPIYLFVALIKSRKKDLKEVAHDSDEIHSVLSSLADRELDVFELTQEATNLAENYQLAEFGAWRNISTFSVLKTEQSLHQEQALETLAHQINETTKRMISDEEEKRHRQEEKDDLKKHKHREVQMPTLVGLSLCIGVCGVILTLYHENIRHAINKYI